MNILFAVGLLTCVYMVRYEYPAVLDEPAVIGWVMQDTPAAKAGIQAGDRIVSIDGIQNPTWEQVIPREALNPNQPLEVTIERGGQIITKTIVPEAYGPNQMGSAGWEPKEASFPITDLEPGMPAEKAGMKLGDEIISVDGQPIAGLEAMIESLKRTKDKPIQITVKRDGKPLNFTVHAGFVGHQGRLALPRGHRQRTHEGVVVAVCGRLSPIGGAEQAGLAADSGAGRKKWCSARFRSAPSKGPIGIGRAAGQAASKKGWTPLLELTAGISLNLGIFNLLPIPIMDGGVILLLFVESIIRRDISLRIKERIYQAAFVFLVLFAVMVIYNDVAEDAAQRDGENALKAAVSYQLLVGFSASNETLSSRPERSEQRSGGTLCFCAQASSGATSSGTTSPLTHSFCVL